MVKPRMCQKHNSEGVPLGHHARDYPQGYPTRGRELCVVAHYKESKEWTTPMGQR